ncbi:hypothetical protein EV426DRAFT_581777 [Tirmania nivea]|nr:hypothetical protein EV426DRAFT_581777 [Tirmania nivea]
MLGILLVPEIAIRVQERVSSHVVSRANSRLEPGEYDIYCDSAINVSDEAGVFRLISHNVSGRDGAFMTGIRARNGRCVIPGIVNSRLRVACGE